MENIPGFGGPTKSLTPPSLPKQESSATYPQTITNPTSNLSHKIPSRFFLIRIDIYIYTYTFWNYVSLMVGNQHVFTMPICPWKMVKRWTFKTHQLPSLQPSLSTWSTFTWNLISTCHVDDLKGFSGERWQERWWVFLPKTPPPLMKAEHRWCLKWIGNH